MTVKLRLALDWTPNVLHIGILVAKALKLDELHGLELELISPDKDNYATTPARKLSLGEVELAICPSESIISYQTSAHPAQLKAVFALLDKDGSAIMCTKRVSRPKDLAGKIYGSYNARFEDLLIQAMVKADGGDAPVRIFSDTAKLDLYQALHEGKIHATWIFTPWEGVKAEIAGYRSNNFRLEDYGITYGYSPVLAYRAAGSVSDEQLESLGSALKQAHIYAKDHPSEAVAILAKYCPQESGEMLSKSFKAVQAYWPADGQYGRMTIDKWSAFLQTLQKHAGLDVPIAPESCFINLACLNDGSGHPAVTEPEKRPPTANAVLQKRSLHKQAAPSPTLIYVSKTTLLHPLLKRIREQLITGKGRKVTLIGMGGAIERAAFLALKCQDMLTSPNIAPDTPTLSIPLTQKANLSRARTENIKLVTHVGTVDLVDDLIPDDPDQDNSSQVRRNSRIEIDLVVISR